MSKRRSSRGRSAPWPTAVVALTVAVAAVVGFWWGRRSISAPDPATAPAEQRAARSERVVPTQLAPAPLEPSPPSPAGRIALVVDDLGRSLDEVDRIVALGVPVAGAVLPYEPRSEGVAARLAQAGLEVMCHLPMEPESSGEDPGPGALRRGMAEKELVAAVERALAAVPGAVGVNNHMGSAFSSDPVAMRTMLTILDRRGLFFLDSRTAAGSVGYRAARVLGVPAAERDVFLDPESGAEAVHREWHRLLEIARERGAAIGLAHPRSVTFEVLAEEIPRAIEGGFELVPVSYLLDRDEAPAP